MKAYVYTFIAVMFAYWIIRKQEEPEIWYNAICALGCAALFVMLVIGVFQLCGCVM